MSKPIYDEARATAAGYPYLKEAYAAATREGWVDDFQWPQYKPMTCWCCRKRVQYYTLSDVSVLGGGNNRRGGSSRRAQVCIRCVTLKVDQVRADRAAGQWPTLDGDGVVWSWAANDFGIYWDDLPKRSGVPALVEQEAGK